jgi:hypothetical protein
MSPILSLSFLFVFLPGLLCAPPALARDGRSVAAAEFSDTFGTLLLTPEERLSVLRHRRSAGKVEGAETQRLRLDGVLRRPDGRRAMIADGQALFEGEILGKADARPRVVEGGVLLDGHAGAWENRSTLRRASSIRHSNPPASRRKQVGRSRLYPENHAADTPRSVEGYALP